MTQKDVVLYYYVKMCLKNLPKNISFSNLLVITYKYIKYKKTLVTMFQKSNRKFYLH
jgi:hypothetical protein